MMGQDNSEGNLFGFRKHGIIQRTGTATPMPESEKKGTTYELSNEILDLEKKDSSEQPSKTPPRKKEMDPGKDRVVEFGLENAKVIDREDEGVLEFGVDGTRSTPGKSKVRRQTTIRDLKKADGGPKLDYISIDEEEERTEAPKKAAIAPKKDTHMPKEEEKEDLDYIPIDDDDASPPPKQAPPPTQQKKGSTNDDAQANYGSMDLKEMRSKEFIFCPHCKSKIEIPSPKRPIVVKCTGCGNKGTLRY